MGDYQKMPDVKQARACGKERAKKFQDRQFTPPQDKKYASTSTGSGRYKLYGLDKFSPIASIPSWTDGTYPIRTEGCLKKTGCPASEAQEEFKKKAAPFLNYNSKYGNFYSP